MSNVKAVDVVLPQEPQPPAPSRRISTLPALLVGLVAGAAVVGLIWLLVGSSGDSISPAGDASAACATLDRVGDLKPVKGMPKKDDGSGFTPAVADRLAAARVLANAAARGDDQYKALSDALDEAHTSIGRNMRLNEESIGRLDEARRQCDQL